MLDRRRLRGLRLQVVDGLPRHQEIFIGSGFERTLDVEQPRLDDDYCYGNAAPVVRMNCRSGQSSTFAPRPRVRPKAPAAFVGIDRSERTGEITTN